MEKDEKKAVKEEMAKDVEKGGCLTPNSVSDPAGPRLPFERGPCKHSKVICNGTKCGL